MAEIDIKNIYDYLGQKVDEVQSRLKQKNKDEEESETQAKELAYESISQCKMILDKNIDEYKKNQELDTYTIAFYGETNAGKSTLIETLRLFFKEKSKMKESEIFRSKLDNLNNITLKVRELIDECKNDLQIDDSFNEKSIDEMIECIEKKEKARKFSFFQKIKMIFIKEPIKEKIKSINKERTQILHINTELENYEDGKIIGNGKSDFTISNSEYRFSLNNQDFKIIDMPGIEGDEKIVINEIEKAVKQAHCVFFVTSESKPPQKGENGKKGTIEKIKEHLSAQSEVYTIYNKRITNPMQLQNDILNEDTKKSLKVLDEKMYEILGEHYAGAKTISARIGFLALTNSIIPHSKIDEEQSKFLNKYSKDELLLKSLLPDFTNFLSNDLVVNTKEKIRISNINKARNILFMFIENIDSLIKTYDSLHGEIEINCENAEDNLENSLRSSKNDIEASLYECVEGFKYKSQERIFSIIEQNISNSDFKYHLERVLKEEQESLKEEIENTLKICLSKFNDRIIADIEEFKRKISLTIKDFRETMISDLNTNSSININIDSGLDKIGLLSSLVGAGGLAWGTPAILALGPVLGPIVLAVGAITLVISFAKSLWGMISSKYKMSKQEEAARKNINDVADRINEAILSSLEDKDGVFDKMEEQIASVIDLLNEPSKRIEASIEYFNNTKNELEEISTNFQ
ncbi:MAG: ATP-binding protein [Campylobacter sp.]|nr:ATP-binding protein [Campylobacter sp.]